MQAGEAELGLTVDGRLVEDVHPLPAESREEDGDEHAQEVVHLEQGVQQHHCPQRPHHHPADHLRSARLACDKTNRLFKTHCLYTKIILHRKKSDRRTL